MAQMLLALAAVVVLAYLVLHKGLGWILKKQRSGETIRVKERISLDAKNSLFLVDFNGQELLIGTSEKGIQILSTPPEQRPSFATIRKNNASLEV